MEMSAMFAAGQPVPRHLLGPLQASALDDSPATLGRRLAEDGYLYLPGALDTGPVLKARQEVFDRLAAVGEIKDPAGDGLATGTSRRAERIGNDLGGFFKKICEAPPAARRQSRT